LKTVNQNIKVTTVDWLPCFYQLSYFLRWPSRVTAKINSHGKIKLTHGKIKLTHGKTKLSHGKIMLTHGKIKLTK
jgi:hypothetical protein